LSQNKDRAHIAVELSEGAIGDEPSAIPP
jgi:hypothetical protein